MLNYMMRFSPMLLRLSILSCIFACNATYGALNTINASVLKLISQKDWQELERNVEPEDILSKFVKSQKYLDPHVKNNNFTEILDFIKQNPHWPQINDIKTALEKSIDDTTNLEDVYHWFQENRPTSSNGYWYYAKSAKLHEKNSDKLSQIIKNAWIYSNWTSADSDSFLRDNTQTLSTQDHIKKIAQLIVNKNIESAKALFYIVDSNAVKLLKIQVDLLKRNPVGLRNFQKLSNAEKLDPNTAIAYLAYLMKQQIPYSNDLYSLLSIRDDGGDQRWTDVRIYFARNLVDGKNFIDAYAIMSSNKPKDATNLLSTHHLAGFIAYKLQKYDVAIDHFTKCIESAIRSTSIARSHYWLASSYDKNNNKNLAQKHFEEAAKYPFVFYGQLSLDQLGSTKINLQEPEIRQKDVDAIKNSGLGIVASLVMQYCDQDLGLKYAMSLVTNAKSKLEKGAAMKYIASVTSNPHIIGMAGRTAIDQGVFVNEAFPTPFDIQNKQIELPWIYATIREESTYDKAAVGSITSDDRGLMQLTPRTAKHICASLGLEFNSDKLLSDAQYNITLGSKYLYDNFRAFKGYYLLAIPAYNVGAGGVRQFVNRYGDPSRLNTLSDIAEWIETISADIPKRYIHKVIETMQIYRFILNKNDMLIVKQDLLRENI